MAIPVPFDLTPKAAAFALRIALAAVGLAFGLAGCSLQKSPAEQAVDAFVAGRIVVPITATGELRDLLIAEDTAGFNLRRRAFPSNAIIELSSHAHPLVANNLNLAGIDLSMSILARADFSGSNLSSAKFDNAYVAETTFVRLLPLRYGASASATSVTDLTSSTFEGAMFEFCYGPEDPGDDGGCFRTPGWLVECRANCDAHFKASRYDDLVRATKDPANPQAGAGFFRGMGRETVEPPVMGTSVENPLRSLADTAESLLAEYGNDLASLRELEAVELRDLRLAGASSADVVHLERDVVLVLGSGFFTHGDIYSLGPVVARGDAKMGSVFARNVVWFTDESMPRRFVFGQPILVDPTARVGQGTSILSRVQPGRWRRAEER